VIRGLHTSAGGMVTQQNSLDVIANNIANVTTTGFKGSTPVVQSFPEIMFQNLHQFPGDAVHNQYNVGNVNMGSVVSNVHINFANGALQQTGGELDLAIAGNGFFVVEATGRTGATQEMFTRSGHLTLTAEDRTLVTMNGNPILDTSGNRITIPDDGLIDINRQGGIYINGNHIADIRLVAFEDNTELRPHGYNLFTTTEQAVEAPFVGSVEQRFLEASNVNIVREMVNMISVSRAYEMNQRMVTMQDGTLAQAVSEIARR